MAIKATSAASTTSGIDRQVLPRGVHSATDSVRGDRWVVQFHPLGSELDQIMTKSDRQVNEQWEKQKMLVSYYTLHHCHPSQTDCLKELALLSSQENAAARVELVFKMIKALEKCILSMSPARSFRCVSDHIELDKQFLILLQKTYLKSRL